jgi:polyisoprenoid-binding protein YceI
MTDVIARPGTRAVNGVEVPVPGTYEIDPSHSSIEVWGRHLMVTKVRGRFARFSGNITIGEDLHDSSAHIVVEANSLETNDQRRDEHLKSADFLAVDQNPTLEFHSTALEQVGDRWRLSGDLTVRGVTRPLTLDLEYEGAAVDPWGNARFSVSGSAEIDREQWGLTWNVPLETGGFLVSKRFTLEVTLQAVAKRQT